MKNIRIITTATLDNNDFQLLQKGYNSGDISISNVLAMGKIPILNIEAINLLFRFFKEKMEKFSIIEGNEQYQTLVETWILAAVNFTYGAKRIFSKESPTKINSLQLLGSPKWKEFEHKFTDWLKENNQTEEFMRDKAETIIGGAEKEHPQLYIIC